MTPFALALLPIVSGALLAATGPHPRRRLAVAGTAVLAATLALAVAGALEGATGRIAWGGGPLALAAAMPPLAGVVAILVAFVATAVVLYAALVEPARDRHRLVGLLLVFAGGMELVVVADDLLTLLVGWEVIGAVSWALVAHEWQEDETVSSAAWAFLVTRTGDLGLFAATMALFSATGSFALAGIAELSGAPLAIVLGGLLVAAAAKAGQVPFSPWLFRAMDGPTSVSALLHAATLVAAGAWLVARIAPLAPEASGFGAAAIVVGLVTAIAGGAVALVQNHVKRLLAASTSAHLGLMFVAAGAGYPLVAILHLVAHAALKAALFLSAGAAHAVRGTYALDRLRIGRAVPWMAAISLAPTLALAGIPPLGGAFTKEKVTVAAGELSPWLALLVAIAGGLSAAYAFRFRVHVFGAGAEAPPGRRPPPVALVPDALLAALTLALSVLWLPAVSGAVAERLGGTIPHASPAEMALSLALVALGMVAGIQIARHAPAIGSGGLAAAAADWLGLPALLERAVVTPFRALAAGLARFDDAVLDALPRGAARGGRALAATLSTSDDAVLDALPRGAARGGRALAATLGTGDDAVVDRGVRAAGRLSQRLAGLSDRIGERLTDGLAEGAARILALSGRDLRRLQTGLAHDYYAILVTGLAGAIAILFLAGP